MANRGSKSKIILRGQFEKSGKSLAYSPDFAVNAIQTMIALCGVQTSHLEHSHLHKMPLIIIVNNYH